MATLKPISTISYNTEAFLREKLESWYKAHKIQSYMYICHKGEDGDKDHIHLRLEPNKKLDPMDLQEDLKEYQYGKEKPLGCRPFRQSKEEDWILYAVHDKKYLEIKYGGGEKGEKLPYKWEDIKADESLDVEIAYIRAKAKMEHTSSNITDKIQQGIDPVKLIQEGENVYVVNAIMRAMAQNDYKRVQEEFQRAQEKLSALLGAIYAFGLEVVQDDEGQVQLRKAPEREGKGAGSGSEQGNGAVALDPTPARGKKNDSKRVRK